MELLPWEKKIRTFLVYALPLALLIPLVTSSDYFFPFIVPRTTVFRILVGITFGLFLMLFINRPRYYIRAKEYILGAFGLLLVLLTFSSLINGDFLYAFWSTYERMEGLLNLYFIFLFAVTLVGVYRTKEDWTYFFRLVIIASIPVAIVGWSQHVGVDFLLASSGGNRVSSTLGNPTYLAAYAVFHIFFALFLLFKAKVDRPKIELIILASIDAMLLITEATAGVFGALFESSSLTMFFFAPQVAIAGAYFLRSDQYRKYAFKLYFLSIIFLHTFVLFNTQTRGAGIGLVIGAFLMLAGSLFAYRKHPMVKRTALAGLLVMIIGISSLFMFKDADIVGSNALLRRFSDISVTDTTAITRLKNWEAAFNGWKEKPIFGWGEERYHVVFNKYFPEDIYRHAGSRVWFDRPHNVFIQYFIAGGLLGGIAYVAIFFFSFWTLYRYWKKTGDATTAILFSALLVAYSIQNAFVFDSLNSYIFFAITLAFIIGVSRQSEEGEAVAQAPVLKRPPILIFLLIFIITYSVTAPKAQANKNYIVAIVELSQAVQQDTLTDEIIENVEERIEQQFLGRFELRQNYADMLRGLLNAPISNDQKVTLVRLAEKLLKRSISEQPDNVRHHAFLSTLYVEAAALDTSFAQKNIELVTDALALSPTRTHLYYAIGRSYLVAGDAEKALESFSTALTLSPKVSDAHINYLAALITTKQLEAAESHLDVMRASLGRELDVTEYLRIAGMYRSTNETSIALRFLNEAHKRYPESIDVLRQQVTYYLELGDTDSAITAAERIAEIDPSFANDLDAFRASLEENGGLLVE